MVWNNVVEFLMKEWAIIFMLINPSTNVTESILMQPVMYPTEQVCEDNVYPVFFASYNAQLLDLDNNIIEIHCNQMDNLVIND
jgi:hypothetical protein